MGWQEWSGRGWFQANGPSGRCSWRRAIIPVKVQGEGENYVRGRKQREEGEIRGGGEGPGLMHWRCSGEAVVGWWCSGRGSREEEVQHEEFKVQRRRGRTVAGWLPLGEEELGLLACGQRREATWMQNQRWLVSKKRDDGHGPVAAARGMVKTREIWCKGLAPLGDGWQRNGIERRLGATGEQGGSPPLDRAREAGRSGSA